MSDEYISRNKLLVNIGRGNWNFMMKFPKEYDECIEKLIHHFAKVVEKMPAEDVAPVKHGEWIPETNNEIGVGKIISVDTYACSNCREWVSVYDAWDIDYKYCPYCGAKMDGRA